MLPSQYVYRTGKSTGDIFLAHKYLLAGSSKRIQMVCAGRDMSKAFDTVDTKKLRDILRKKRIEEENVSITEQTPTQSDNHESKIGKMIGELFNTNRGIPQGTR